MPGDIEIYSPVTYSPVWTWIAIGLIAIIVGWVLTVLILTRKPKQPPVIAPPPIPPLDLLRGKAMAALAETVQKYQQGQLDTRHAHSQISRTLRRFTAEATGAPVDTLTLEELKHGARLPIPPAVIDAVAAYYNPEFAQHSTERVEDSANRAAAVIQQWR